jgi:hypothetical protein
MKRRNPPITLSTLPARAIYHAVLQVTQHHPRPHTKGRKPLYPEALLLTLALLRTARRASYRHLLFCLAPEALPDQPVPALGTLLYRLKTISDERWHARLSWLAAQGIAKEPPNAPLATPVVLVDGTGVGFNTPFDAPFRRGAELRRIRSHLKAVVLVYWRGGQRGVVGASLGRAYADEGRLLAQWLGRYGSWGVGSGALLVGDKLYGYRGRLLARVEQVGWLPVARVEAGVRQGVRDKARVRVLERLGAYGWALGARYRIEQVFGRVKGVYGSYVGCRCWGYARVWVWGMWVLWNLVPWLRVGGDGGDCLCVVFVVWGG